MLVVEVVELGAASSPWVLAPQVVPVARRCSLALLEAVPLLVQPLQAVEVGLVELAVLLLVRLVWPEAIRSALLLGVGPEVESLPPPRPLPEALEVAALVALLQLQVA